MSTPTVAEEPKTTDKKPATHAHAKPAHAPKKKLHPLVQRFRKPALIVAGIAAAIVTAYYVYDAYTHEETDDAYVTGHLHAIAPRIAGTVTDVLVDDNQLVHQGDVLVKLDPMQYIALEMAAKANLDARQIRLRSAEAAHLDQRRLAARRRQRAQQVRDGRSRV